PQVAYPHTAPSPPSAVPLQPAVGGAIAEIGPLPEYRRRIALGLLKPDQDQFRAAVRLQDLCTDLLDYKPPEIKPLPGPPLTRGFGSGFFGGASVLSPNAFAGKSLIPILIDGQEPDYIGPRGLWIHGEVGTGKTLVMDLFYDTFPSPNKRRIHFHHFMHAAYAKLNDWHRLNPESVARHAGEQLVSPKTASLATAAVARELARSAWMWCFDEFQVTDVATATLVRQLFAHMFRLGVVVVATSNRKPDDLYQGGFQRDIYGPFIDLIKERCDVYHMRSDIDYRVLMLEENQPREDEQLFYSLEKDESAQRFIKRVTSLFYGHTPKKEKFVIYGREVVVPKAAKGKAIFTFEELCGSNNNNPMGPADYLELCRRYHTIVLQSIPSLGLAQKNEARRFITFIDAAYENHVKLVISADVESPEGLFVTAPISTAADDEGSSNSSSNSDDDDVGKDAVMHREMLGDLYGGMVRQAEGGGDPAGVGLEFVKVAIFTGEDERFAFKRAVSRLKEMGSASYVAVPHRPVGLDWSGLEGVRGTPGATAELPKPPKAVTLEREWDLVDKEELSVEVAAAAAIAGQDAPRGVVLEGEKGRQVFGDDFSEEASYSGFVEMHGRYKSQEESIKKERTAVGKASNFLSTHRRGDAVAAVDEDGPILLGQMAKKEKNAPKFQETHFWGVGRWGRRSSLLGEGIRAFWSNLNFADQRVKEAKGTPEDDLKDRKAGKGRKDSE
ncbi:AFG1-like ATPase-domain-containing protein, partial [Zopfochytrium polystomum]